MGPREPTGAPRSMTNHHGPVIVVDQPDGDVAHASGLRQAVEDVLACPSCHGRLSLDERPAPCLRCARCGEVFPIIDGIPVLRAAQSLAQADEQQFRDAFAAQYMGWSGPALLDVVAQHHSLPVMRRRVRAFDARFAPNDWIVDVGTGFGWHWRDLDPGAKVVAVDFSLGNLRLARHVLQSTKRQVLLVCADAAALPLQDRAMAGLWSVQAFQHFPDGVLQQVQAELDRVLRPTFFMEITNVNPAVAVRAIYRLVGRRFHRRGARGPMALNCRSEAEWAALWRSFRAGRVQISHGHSELFFHPDLRLRPWPYPLWLEQAIAVHAAPLAALAARQITIRVESAGSASRASGR